MTITGITDSRLNEVKTYDKNQPYQIGYKGVTNVQYNQYNDPEIVEYTINDINYKTVIGKSLYPKGLNTEDISVFKSDTTYSFESDGLDEYEVNVLKQEAEMGLSEPPKIESDIFIERQEISVFERHLRMGEINSLEQLDEYKNGYYNIFKLN